LVNSEEKSERKLKPAAENPWYVLATIAGEQAPRFETARRITAGLWAKVSGVVSERLRTYIACHLPIEVDFGSTLFPSNQP